MTEGLLHTATGREVPLCAFTPAHVHAEDIAHALAHLCRFGGHTRTFYSVAEHSWRVAHLLWQTSHEDAQLALYGLLHDASEAYLGDVVTPLKRQLGEVYAAIERTVQGAIYQAFGLAPVTPSIVHLADQVLLVTEARDLLVGQPAWGPPDAALTQRIQPFVAAPCVASAAEAWLEMLDFYQTRRAEGQARREQAS